MTAIRQRAALAVALVMGACSGSGSGPRVVATSPQPGATGVDPGVVVRVTFDEAIDPATLQAGITVAPGHPFAVSWLGDERTAELRFDPALATGVDYEITVSTSITDVEGRALVAEHRFGFAVRPALACPAQATTSYQHGGHTAWVDVSGDPLRGYTLHSDAPLRDGLPSSGQVSFAERADQMVLRSGHVLFDALFAMAIEEVRQDSVSEIRDGSFYGGAPIPCECFETGEKWTYVWTRDTAYATHLALALVDPGRARRSLEFKLSERKGGGDVQIVQDTGSGGSYPVSSDRVVWALGARETLAFLHGAEREQFRDRAFEAMVNTAEQDRRIVYDPADGLYRGEQSFLDWREQSYPSWTAANTSPIAESKALSTNVGHLALLELLAELATEKGDSAAAARYRGWADELAAAIAAELLAGGPSSMKISELGAFAIGQRDLLGQSLAVIAGLISDPSVIASYPRAPTGPPVFWPQQPNVPIYHNRGNWPFVTAYDLLAARALGNPAVLDHDVEALVRGAALNLSNMENLDFSTGANWTDDGSRSGPVVNSRRQLWSVAGYLAMVIKGMFGLEATQAGIRFRPTITWEQRRRWFGQRDSVWLRNVPYRGRRIDVELRLPDCDPGATGMLAIAGVWVDGVETGDRYLAAGELGDRSTVVVSLIAGDPAPGSLVELANPTDPIQYAAPRDPLITQIVWSGGALELTLDSRGETGVTFDVIRDGASIASGISGTSYRDTGSIDPATRTHCYAAVASRAGKRSLPSPPFCFWGDTGQRVREIDASSFVATGGSFSTQYGRPHYQSWGAPDHELVLPGFQPSQSGLHYIQAIYGNGAGPVSTGITAAVKWVTMRDEADDSVVGEGALVMPQRGSWDIWAESTLLRVELDASRTYSITISDSTNMSYFDHFTGYGGSGGGDQPYNDVNITALRFLSM